MSVKLMLSFDVRYRDELEDHQRQVSELQAKLRQVFKAECSTSSCVIAQSRRIGRLVEIVELVERVTANQAGNQFNVDFNLELPRFVPANDAW